MKTAIRYVDEVSGKEFKSLQEAQKSESRHSAIKNIFSFWKFVPKDKDCSFGNGNWCHQRTETEYFRLIDGIIEAVNKHEKWIAKDYAKHGGLKREYVMGGTFLGRYLNDSHSPIDRWFAIQMCICPKCYREWGQPYFAINCKHDIQPKALPWQK